MLLFIPLALCPKGLARPMVCTTTLEAPAGISAPAEGVAQPVEVTRCAPVETTEALVERRFYTWTSSYARGVDLLHQVTDLFGIALAGSDGQRLMGLGFPDQTIIWDGSALQNTTQMLLEEQSAPIPWRTVDLSNGFGSSLAEEEMQQPESVVQPSPDPFPAVRALW
ncbi:MAG: hypothetical protein ISQ53_00025 [Synechococcus sp. BS307-5m-G39]|nr:hypothetical protein [Synechococcus sp. BS307-5m-G39]